MHSALPAQHLECRQGQAVGKAMRKAVSQHKVANAGSERDDERVDVQAGGCAGELGHGGLGCAAGAGGLDAGSVGADDGVGTSRRNVGGRRGVDGAGLVCDCARGGRARHGDGVDAVDGRGEVDGSVVGLTLLGGEDTGDEREEEDDDVLEGAHGG